MTDNADQTGDEKIAAATARAEQEEFAGSEERRQTPSDEHIDADDSEAARRTDADADQSETSRDDGS